MKWFRLWIDILDDPKLAVSVTDDETFRFLINLMAYARELDNAGKIDQPIEIISWRLRLEIPKINAYLKHLKDLKIITTSPEIKFLNWDKRQYLSDNSTERVKRFRIKNETLRKQKRNGGLCTETEAYNTDTDTDTDTDTETETETENTLSAQNADGERFDQFWQQYPRHEKKKNALEAFKRINSKNGNFEKIMEALAKQKMSAQWTKDGGKFIPHPTTWLNGRRWEDEIKDCNPDKHETAFDRTQKNIESFKKRVGIKKDVLEVSNGKN